MPVQLPPTTRADANFCSAQMMVTAAGTDNATGLFLGSVMVSATNTGPVAVPTPWTITVTNPYYVGVSQAGPAPLAAMCSANHRSGSLDSASIETGDWRSCMQACCHYLFKIALRAHVHIVECTLPQVAGWCHQVTQSTEEIWCLQAFGLSSPQYTIGGTLTGTAGDYWDVLWPHATNEVSVGFLVLSRSPAQLAPSKVSPVVASGGLLLHIDVHTEHGCHQWSQSTQLVIKVTMQSMQSAARHN